MKDPQPLQVDTRPVRIGDKVLPRDLAIVHTAVVKGDSLEEIDADHGWPGGRAEEIYQTLISQEEVRHSGRKASQVFADYTLRSNRHVKQLDGVFDLAASPDGNLSAAVAAVRAKQDILDRVIKAGQDLGQISKRPQEHTLLVATLDDAGLQDLVMRELRALQDLAARHGGRSLVDIQPERVLTPALEAEQFTPDVDFGALTPPDLDGPAPPPPLPPSRQGVAQPRSAVAPPIAATAGSGPDRPPVVRRKAVIRT